MTTCPTMHEKLNSRYCHDCGKKLDQPALDLLAHCRSQCAKARGQNRDRAALKWAAWAEAIEKLLEPRA